MMYLIAVAALVVAYEGIAFLTRRMEGRREDMSSRADLLRRLRALQKRAS